MMKKLSVILVPFVLTTLALARYLAQDNFTRANGALGANWTTTAASATGAAAPQIVSNQVQAASVGTGIGTSGSYAYWNAITPANDQWAEIQIIAATTAASDAVGAMCRVSTSTTALTGYLADVNGTGSGTATLHLWKIVSGTFTQLATTSTGTFLANDLLRITCQGSTISLLRNGVSQLSASDSAIASGQQGIHLEVDAGVLTDSIGGNFNAGDFVSTLPSLGVGAAIVEQSGVDSRGV